MRKRKWTLLILAIITILSEFIWSVSAATNFSNVDSWMTFRHDLIHSGFITNNSTMNSAKLLWKHATNSSVFSSPAVADGYVFVGSKDGYIYCLNASNGRLFWNFPTGGEVNSSPAIDNGRVYVGSDDGWFYCLNTSTGYPFWITHLGGFVMSSPAIVDGRAYIGSGKHDLFCLNTSDGTVIWSYPTKHPVRSSPAVSAGVVYFASDDYSVYAINASTGAKIWHHHTGSMVSSPSVNDGCIYIGSHEGNISCLNAFTGSKIWEYQTQDEVASSPAVAYGCVYVGSEDNNVYCLNSSNGHKLWKVQTGYWVWSSPAVAGGNVYVGSEDYNMYCLSASNGSKKWSFAAGNYVDSSPAIVNNTLFFGSHDNSVYAFTLSNSTVENSLLKPSSSIPWSTIAFDGIACSFAAIIILAFVALVRSTKPRTATRLNVRSQIKAWFSAHIDAICILAILAFSSIFFYKIIFGNQAGGYLWAADEKTYSQMAFHMIKSGDYLTPSVDGGLGIFAGKPPFMIWLISISYQVFGVNNFAARFWSPIFAALSLVVIFFLGKKLYNVYIGFLSALVLGSFTTFAMYATRAMMDVPLIFFILASVYCMLLSDKTNNDVRYAALSGLFFGLAFMTKQVQALLIPFIIIGYFAAVKRSIRFLFTKRFVLFLAVALLVFVPWIIYMGLRFGGLFWDCYFVYADFVRIISPIEGHVGSYLYYFNYLATGENLIWIIILPFAVGLCAFNSIAKRAKPDVLVLAWIAIVLIIFTAAQTKMSYYILSAYPAFAIAIASFIYKLVEQMRLRIHL